MLRKIAGVLIGLYGSALLILFLFSFFWDNKGASSIWDKSTADWLLVIWLAVSALVILNGARHCMFKQCRTYIPILLVGMIILVNVILLATRASGEAIMLLGTPHLIAGVGILLWLGVEFTDRKQKRKTGSENNIH